MSKKASYKEPSLPEGRNAFTHALSEITKIPLDAFLRADDGRKFLVKCRNRQYLLQKLASFADPDGTSCYPSIERLLDETKFSNGTLNSYLKDLESDELGFVVKGGYAWEDGPRVRRLTLPTGERSGLQDSNQDYRIGVSGLQDSRAGFQYTKAGLQSGLETTRQYLDPTDLDPTEKDPPPPDPNAAGGFLSSSKPKPTGKKRIAPYLREVRDAFHEVMTEAECAHNTLNIKAAESLFVGRAPEELPYIVTDFLTTRSWIGLTHPETKFLEEFPDFYDAFQEKQAEADIQLVSPASSNAPDPKSANWNAYGSNISVEGWICAADRLGHDNEWIANKTGLSVSDVVRILNGPANVAGVPR